MGTSVCWCILRTIYTQPIAMSKEKGVISQDLTFCQLHRITSRRGVWGEGGRAGGGGREMGESYCPNWDFNSTSPFLGPAL